MVLKPLIVLGMLLAGCSWTAVAVAAFSAGATAAPALSTLSLSPPASVSATTSDGCATVVVSWTAAAGATSYRVQVREGAGAWIDLNAETGDVTSITDSAGHAGTSVEYRAYARHVASGWQSDLAAVSSALAC